MTVATVRRRRPRQRAAFFDLDKTLMAGSSGVFFARAAYETGMISRRGLSWTSRERPLQAARLDRRPRRRRAQAGRRDDRGGARARPRAPLARVLERRAAAPLPADARARLRPPGRGHARLHPDGRIAGDGRPAGPRARLRRRSGLALGDRRRPLHGASRGAVQLPRGQGALDARAWPSARGSTWPPPTPTRTPSPTCRCCAPSATPSSSTPTRCCGGSRCEEGWEVIELDRLGRRLKLLAVVGAGTALASAGRGLVERGAVRRPAEKPVRARGAARQARARAPAMRS